MTEYVVRDAHTGLLDTWDGEAEQGATVLVGGREFVVVDETWASYAQRARKEGRDLGSVQIRVSENFEQVVGYVMPTDHPSIDACGIKRNEDGDPVFTSREQIRKFNVDSQKRNEKDPRVPCYGWDGKKE
jgi:hypothetical protein